MVMMLELQLVGAGSESDHSFIYICSFIHVVLPGDNSGQAVHSRVTLLPVSCFVVFVAVFIMHY